MELTKSIAVSAAGLRAQSMRMRIIAENISQANSTATQNSDPYRRKMVTFQSALDRELGVETVEITGVTFDQSAFGRKFDPSHPAADEEGYIQTTNVNTIVETMDMRDAQRTYQANVSAIEASKKMMLQTLELLR